MVLLLFFVPILFIIIKQKSISVLLLTILSISLIGSTLLGRQNEIELINILDVFILFFIGFVLIMVISPWQDYKNVYKFNVDVSHKKLRIITNLLIGINFVSFVIFLITTIIVQTTITDIDQFKYTEGATLDFFSSRLPFDMRFLIFATLISGFSYFLLPLHFYYLSVKKYRLAIICFFLSLVIILKGTTYFSRAVIVEYILLYGSFYWLLNNTIDKKVKKVILYIVLLPILIYFGNMFFGITNERFKDTTYYDSNLVRSPIENPEIYSLVDYLSQWYYNGFKILKQYNFETFQGKISLEPLNSLLGRYGISDYRGEDYILLRSRLWGENSTTFTGLVAYSVYDYGIFLTIVFSILYYRAVKFKRPRNGVVKLSTLFLIVLLIQIALMAIFYSKVGQLLFPLIFYGLLNFYFKYRFKH